MVHCVLVGVFVFQLVFLFFFFFQAEDGIRDHCVTGVQTCALPIWMRAKGFSEMDALHVLSFVLQERTGNATAAGTGFERQRSEEHTSELQSHSDLVCRLLLEKKKKKKKKVT